MSLYERARANPGGHRDITATEVWQDRAEVRVIDVREPHEFNNELGHVAGAALVPLATVGDAARDWPRDQEVVLVCRSGKRSGRAAEALAREGFRVMNLVGGMIAWNELGLPIERG